MFKIAIIIFREFLELSLLIGIVLASTAHIKNSKIYAIIGIMTGVVSACFFALFVRNITQSYGTYGDELIDSCIILVTAVIISSTIVWMQGYTKKIKLNLSNISENPTKLSIALLIALIASSILREGAEMILFIYSIASTQKIAVNEYIIGLAIGAFSGLTTGLVIYSGLIKFAGKYIFKISTILLTFIAAGLASEAAGILTASGFIEIYNEQLWDISWFVDNNSLLGKILHITIGYDAKPNIMQIIFYLGSIALTVLMSKLRTIFTKRKLKNA